jgi:hypothetical protein
MINGSYLRDARRTLLLSFGLILISMLPANAFFVVDETTGQVTFRITRLQGPNAVLSALFFDE